MWLKPKEAAEQIGVCNETILRYIREDKLIAHKLGKRTYRISPEELDAFMRNAKEAVQ